MIMKLMMMMMMMMTMLILMMMMMMLATTMSQCLRESWVVSILCWAQFYPCSDCYHSSVSKNISVHISEDIWRIIQAVSNVTIVSITADAERVWLPTQERV